VQLVDAPLPSSPGSLAPTQVVVFTDDGRHRSRNRGPTGRFRPAESPLATCRCRTETPPPCTTGLTDDPDAVETLLKEIRRQHGPIAGVVSSPLAEPPRAEGPMERMQRELASLYLLARASSRGPGKRRTGSLAHRHQPGRIGVRRPAASDNYFGGHGGIIGFEMPRSNDRKCSFAVDLDIHERGSRAPSRVERSKRADQVGYLNGRRITWEAVAAPLYKNSTRPPILNGDRPS
jgi:hypothetical protein